MDSNPGLWASQSVPLTSCQLPSLRLTPRPTCLQREKWTHPSLPVTSPPLPPGPSSSWSLFLLVPLPPSLEYRAQQGLLTSWPSLKSSNRLASFLHVLRESLLTAQGAASWGNWKVPDISQSTVVTGLSGNASGIRPACIITCTERPLDLRSQAGWRPGWLLGCGI